MLGKIKVRFKLAWQNYRVGDEIWPPGTLRQWLLERGYVDVVADEPARAVEQPAIRRRRLDKNK